MPNLYLEQLEQNVKDAEQLVSEVKKNPQSTLAAVRDANNHLQVCRGMMLEEKYSALSDKVLSLVQSEKIDKKDIRFVAKLIASAIVYGAKYPTNQPANTAQTEPSFEADALEADAGA